MMYWSDWSSSNAQNGKIETAWMNGDQRKVFVDTELQWPNGLTIDYFNRKLYWCDSYLNKIERISLSGIDREVSSNNAFVCGYTILSTLKPSFSDFDGTRFWIVQISQTFSETKIKTPETQIPNIRITLLLSYCGYNVTVFSTLNENLVLTLYSENYNKLLL